MRHMKILGVDFIAREVPPITAPKTLSSTHAAAMMALASEAMQQYTETANLAADGSDAYGLALHKAAIDVLVGVRATNPDDSMLNRFNSLMYANYGRRVLLGSGLWSHIHLKLVTDMIDVAANALLGVLEVQAPIDPSRSASA